MPPHCKPSRRHVIAGTRNSVPTGSICRSFCQEERLLIPSLGGVGSSTHQAVNNMARGHNGMLMPKHARQLKASIRTPPRRGAHERPIACVIPERPIQSDLLCDGNICAIKVMPPADNALVPRPAIALPTMNTGEEVAKVQMMDPRRKMQSPTSATVFGDMIVQALPRLYGISLIIGLSNRWFLTKV